MKKLSEIADVLGCEVPKGKGDLAISRIASLAGADDTSITFLVKPAQKEAALASAAAAFIVKKGYPLDGKVCLEVDDPYLGYALAAQLFEDTEPLFGPEQATTADIDPSAAIAPGVSIGPGTVIGPECRIGPGTVIDAGCVVEKDTAIGGACRIQSGAVIRYGTVIGDRVIIQSGAVIGSEGFGNAMRGREFVRIPCFGNVVIEDDVWIGACTTIDRGNFEPTVIRKGVRLDNLIHIAHNVVVDENTAMAAQVGISGSTTVGKNVIIAGQAGFVGHIHIGDGSFIGAKAGISKTVEPGAKVTGYPARDLMKMRRIEAAQANLPDLLKKMKKLEADVAALKDRNADHT